MIKTVVLSFAIAGALTGAALADDGMADWSGYYLGVHGGYGVGTLSDSAGTAFADTEVRGGFGGGQWGYNFSLVDGIVMGIEADINWAKQEGTSADSVSGVGGIYHSVFTDTVNWTGAVTGKLGVALGPLLPYALGGVAFANSTLDNTGNDVMGNFSSTQSATHTGWVGGVGLAAAVAPGLSTFGEYRYADYGTATYITGAGQSDVRLTDHSVRVGVNFRP